MQAANAAPSRRHLKVAPASSEKANVALRELVSAGGWESIDGAAGGVASIENVFAELNPVPPASDSTVGSRSTSGARQKRGPATP